MFCCVGNDDDLRSVTLGADGALRHQVQELGVESDSSPRKRRCSLTASLHEAGHRDPGNLDRVLKPEENSPSGAVLDRQRQQVAAQELDRALVTAVAGQTDARSICPNRSGP